MSFRPLRNWWRSLACDCRWTGYGALSWLGIAAQERDSAPALVRWYMCAPCRWLQRKVCNRQTGSRAMCWRHSRASAGRAWGKERLAIHSYSITLALPVFSAWPSPWVVVMGCDQSFRRFALTGDCRKRSVHRLEGRKSRFSSVPFAAVPRARWFSRLRKQQAGGTTCLPWLSSA